MEVDSWGKPQRIFCVEEGSKHFGKGLGTKSLKRESSIHLEDGPLAAQKGKLTPNQQYTDGFHGFQAIIGC
jgi:hypothetical protein